MGVLRSAVLLACSAAVLADTQVSPLGPIGKRTGGCPLFNTVTALLMRARHLRGSKDTNKPSAIEDY